MIKQIIHTRQADAKGRVTLGRAFANQVVLIEDRGDEVLVRLGRVIPAREAWLYENPKALASVRKGLSEARRGKLVDGPDLAASAKLAEQIPDE